MREQLQEQLEQAQTGRQQRVLAYNALKELDDQVNNVLSAQQEAHGYFEYPPISVRPAERPRK